MKKFYFLIACVPFSIQLHAQLKLVSDQKPEKTNQILSAQRSPFQQDESPLKMYETALFQPPTGDKIYIDFVGTGDIQKSISQGSDINANTGVGVIFERYRTLYKAVQSFELEGIINIASTADTIEAQFSDDQIFLNQRDFGTYILNPISAKQSLFINANVYFGYPYKSSKTQETWKPEWKSLRTFGKISTIVSGLNFRIISSNSTWVFKNNDMNRVSNLGVMAFRGGIFHEFIPDNYRMTDLGRSKYSLCLGVSYAFRGVFGDITSSKNDDLAEQILGSSQTRFHGVEFNFGFRLSNLRAEFQMPLLKPKDSSIDGLTDTQFMFSIKFVGGFSLQLDSIQKQNE